MKVAICIEIKNENKYILEWVNYHRKLGIDNIILGDNNDSDGENIFDVLEKEITEGYIIYEDVKDKTNYQMPFYNYCINKYKNDFDWILFIDCDEFVELKENKSIKEWLSREKFNNFNQIIINMYNYTADDVISDDDCGVLKRFTKKINREFFGHVWQTKCCLRVNKQTDEMVFKTAHFVTLYNTTCDTNGNKIFPTSFLSGGNESCIIRHYKTKTLEEYLSRHKYDCFYNMNIQLIAKKIKSFFDINSSKKNLKSLVNIVKKEFPWYSHCYNNCAPIDIVLIDNGNPTLKYTIKSIQQNLTWVNDIFIVSEHNLNFKNIKIIHPKEIINDEFINIKNIDIGFFLHNIPGISERFIYVYAGTIFNYKCFEDEFFKGDKVCMYPENFAQIPKNSRNIVLNNNLFILNRNDLTCLETFKLSASDTGYMFNNVCCPMRKLDNAACLNYLKDDIKNNANNINHLIYPIWSRLMYNTINYTCSNVSIESSDNPVLEIIDPVYKIINIGKLCETLDVLYALENRFEDEKIALCLICKNENTDDLHKTINYYKKIGFDNIIFYDGNTDLNQFNSVEKYIKTKFVLYNSCPNFENNIKANIMQLCYDTYKTQFNYLAFLDIDEYLIINNFDDIKSYLKSIKHLNYDILQLDRKSVIYDNNMQIAEFNNSFVKSIFKCKKTLSINTTNTYSTNILSLHNKFVHIDGNHNITLNRGMQNCAFNNIYIKHIHSTSFDNFIYKLKTPSIKENIFNKILLSDIEYKLKQYFTYIPLNSNHLKTLNIAFPNFNITKESIFNEIDLNIKTDIDYVFPYVDNNDIEWQKEYNKYITNTNDDGTLSGVVRYESYDLLKFKFRSIEKNMPWIRNIYMIVSGPTQVPKWLNTDKVKIIYHKDIIPAEFLPTFNSSTIEMFIGNIEGLSENFLYGNDDCYINIPLMPYMFFRNNLPLIHLHERKITNKKTKLDISINASNFVKNDIDLIKQNTDYSNLDKLFIPDHHIKPQIKSSINKILKMHKDKIYAGCTKFRSDNNFNQYLYHYYQVFNYKYIPYKRKTKVINYKGGDFLCIQDELSNKNNLFSLDFAEEVKNKNILYNIFSNEFSNKSIFEK